MRSPRGAVVSMLFLLYSSVTLASEPMCGTSSERDEYLRSVLSRPRERARIAAHASVAPLLHDGAFYVQADGGIMPGNRPFNLDGQSLVFEPRGATTFAVTREPLRYVEPSGPHVRDFQVTEEAYLYELSFAMPLFGREVTRIYVSRFNAIHLDPPSALRSGEQFDDLAAAVERRPVISPLMITTGKPRFLAYPQLFIDETASGVVLTWRSTAGATFGYDVQAELHRDGEIVFSYRSPRNMRWGTPIISAGFDPAAAQRVLLGSVTDSRGEVVAPVTSAVRAMVDIVQTDVTRIGSSDLFAVRVRFAGPVSAGHLEPGQSVRFTAVVNNEWAYVEIDQSGTRVTPFGAFASAVDGPAAHIQGDTIEIFGLQKTPSSPATVDVRVFAQVRPQTTAFDQSNFSATFPPASQRIASDFHALQPGTELATPITQPFLLGPFDPFETWRRIQATFPVSEHEVDAVAMYQTFFTDMIFYAGAYATVGNAQVDGIAPPSVMRGSGMPRNPNLLHMNQLNYNYSSQPRTAARVLLHELGHRWLYFFRIRENGATSSVLNPAGAHPAGYVHTPSAFPIYGAEESSVMGGGYFKPEAEGSWRTVATNDGYSWTDLYLMGLATPEEVTPWFYLANTQPQLPGAYWPQNDIVVSGERRDVAVGQILDVHGARTPAAGLSQRQFRVLFVLVTEEGKEPSAVEIAKLNEWRALLEHNFAVATGGRGSIRTSFVQPSRKRAVR